MTIERTARLLPVPPRLRHLMVDGETPPRDDSPLAVGEIVMLQSGSPAMTVTAVDGDEITVTWATRRAPDLQVATLPAAALVRAVPQD